MGIAGGGHPAHGIASTLCAPCAACDCVLASQLLGTGSFARVFAAGVATTATRPAARRPLFGDSAAARSAPLDLCGLSVSTTALVHTAMGTRKLPRVVAVKQYNRAALREPAMRDMVMAEARAMRDAGDHENVCRLLDAFEDHRGVSLVMDHCAGGTLLGALRRARAAAARAGPSAAPGPRGKAGVPLSSGKGTPTSKGSSSPTSSLASGRSRAARSAGTGKRAFIGNLQPHQARRVARRKPLDSEARGAIPPELARPAMLAMARGVRHLHRRGIAHRDVKLENVVVDGSAAGTGASDAVAAGRIRLCDFGFATRVQSQASASKAAAQAFGVQMAIGGPSSSAGVGRGVGRVGLTPPPPLPPRSPAFSVSPSQRSVSPPPLPPSPAGLVANSAHFSGGTAVAFPVASGAGTGLPHAGGQAPSASMPSAVGQGKLSGIAQETVDGQTQGPDPSVASLFAAAAEAGGVAGFDSDPPPDQACLASESFGSDGHDSICERQIRPSTPNRRPVVGPSTAKPLGVARGPTQRLSAATPPPRAAPSPPPTPPLRVTEARGSLVYMAPEALVRGHTHHARPTDVWSLGVCFYLLLTGQFPFRGDSEADVIRMVRTRPPNATADGLPLGHPASELTLRLLDRSAKTRPSAEELCAHPWLRGGVVDDDASDGDCSDGMDHEDRVDVTKLPAVPQPPKAEPTGWPLLAVDVGDPGDCEPQGTAKPGQQHSSSAQDHPAASQPAPIPPASPFPTRQGAGESPRSGQRISPRSCVSSNSSSTQSLPHEVEASATEQGSARGIRRPVAGGIGIGASSPRASLARARVTHDRAAPRQHPPRQAGNAVSEGASVGLLAEVVGPRQAGQAVAGVGSGPGGSGRGKSSTSPSGGGRAGPGSVRSDGSSGASKRTSVAATAGRSEQLRSAILAGRARRGTNGRPPAQPTSQVRSGAHDRAGTGFRRAAGQAVGDRSHARREGPTSARVPGVPPRPRSGVVANPSGLSRIRPTRTSAAAGGGDSGACGTRPKILPALQSLMSAGGAPYAGRGASVGASVRTERRPRSAIRKPVATRVAEKTGMASHRTSKLERVGQGGAGASSRASGALRKTGQQRAEAKSEASKSEESR